MAGRSFEDTVKNLLRMKPKPHKEKGKGEKGGDGPGAAPDTGSKEQKP